MTWRAKASSIHYQWKYDVFLNFRGEDTRCGFTRNLSKALHKMGIRTFFDDNEIRIGDEIKPTLLEAIKESRMAITVFSENYASSTFCLNELVQIHQCIMGNGRLVWPIFYDVEPSEVRHQKQKYGEALVAHEQNSRADEDKINSWKHALREVANLKGSSHNSRKNYEYKLIDEIVNGILRIIKRDRLHVAEYPVGLNSRLEKINSLLQLGSNNEVIMFGICGTGGMGKTTIARALYNAIADQFDYLCFLNDIKGESGKQGLKQVQASMLSSISEQKMEIEDIYRGVELMKRILRDKKNLLILDNVDERQQLEMLAGACDWFGLGSRIIITTRDVQLLKSHGVERIYELEGLNAEESLELLKWKAFRKTQDDDGVPLEYKNVVNQVISYAAGLPLAIELIGSDLYFKDVNKWESKLDGCKKIPHDKIQQILRGSYDGLETLEKEVFLDISCFYKRRGLYYVKEMVARTHDFDPEYHIGVLVDKCLIKIRSNYIEIHDLIQDMGREVVRQQSPKNPGKRSRLWSNEDIMHVLERDEGTNEIIIIIQDKWYECIKVNWNGEAFKSMSSLKILILKNTNFSQDPKYLPNSLVVLRWSGYPSPNLPSGFHPRDLTEFGVANSNFSSIQTISKIMQNVSVLNFGDCKYIRQIPNVSGLSSLKELRLRYCKNLIEIDNSVGQLPKLEILDVHDCTQLKTFPSELNTPSLDYLGLFNCSNLNYFPEIVSRDMKISYLNLSGTGINQLPRSIENLTRLEEVENEQYFTGRSMKLPSTIWSLPELQSINIQGCEELLMDVTSTICPYIRRLYLFHCNISNEKLRIYLTAFSNVVSLDLTGNPFAILPACIGDCQKLVDLVLDECQNLIQVEKVPPSIERLTAVNCTSLSSESRTLLLSKDLLASTVTINDLPCASRDNWYDPHKAYFNVSGGSIPEWFDHCSKGPSISFWFRGYFFPSLCVCAIIKPMEFEDFESRVQTEVFVNDEIAHKDESMWYVKLGNLGDQILVYYIWDCNINKSFEEDQWTHAEICCELLDWEDDPKESGIYVIRDEWTNMENIRFTDPFQSSDFLRGDQDGKLNETNMDAPTEGDEPLNINSLDIPSRCHEKRKRNCLMKQHENSANSPNANHHDSINNQGCATEGDTATKKPAFPFQSEKQHTHSHAVLDFDSLRRLSTAYRKLAFPVSIHMNPGIVGSQLEYDFIITEQDAIEFLSMQELCITIIQLFVMFCNELCIFRGIDDRFGFLCPNAVQSVGRTRQDRICYIGSTVKEGNKKCWLAPIHEGNHWTLCAICQESNIVYWFDSLGGEQSEDIKEVFTEALEIIGGRNIKWLRPNCRHQGGDKECGYYIMGYMYDIIDLNEVDSLDTHFNNPQCYSQEDINFIRNKWSAYVLEVHAPTSCRSRPEDRVKRLLFGRT